MEDNGKKILVVDDEPDICVYLVTLLEDHGYQAYQARSAREALELLTQVKPDLITFDIMMPKQSGIALYRKLKLDEKYRDIPTIFISAFSMARDFSGRGFRKLIPDKEVPEPLAYLEKPIHQGRLLEIVQDIFQERG